VARPSGRSRDRALGDESADPRRFTSGVGSSRLRAAVAIAVLFSLVFTLREAVALQGFAFSLLYVVPIALVAVVFGLWTGVAAATSGLVLLALGDATAPVSAGGMAISTNAIGYVSHAVTFYLLAVLLGWYSDRVRHVNGLLSEASGAVAAANSDFLSRVSHELRTPLAAILGFSELLGLQDLDALTRHRVQTIEKAGRHLLTLVTDVLDISRIEAGAFTISIEAIPVAPALEEALALMQGVADTTGITLATPLVASHCQHLLGDAVRLKQVVLNLISNAIKYNSEGGVVGIEVASAPAESQTGGPDAEPRRMARISVTDNGPGLDEASLRKLFVPFERLGASTTNVEGAGLGLSLSKALVERMGGTLGVDSTVGEGSTFWLELEAAESTESHEQTAASTPAPSGSLSERMVRPIERPALAVELPQRRESDALLERMTRAFRETLCAGEPHAAALVIDEALEAGISPVRIQSQVITPSMNSLGELWERGELTIADEHLASAISHTMLARLYPALLGQAQRSGDTVVVAGVQGEEHVLGLRMAADVFEGAGFDVRFLGAGVPEASLLAWVAEHQPSIVALGATMPVNGATLLRQCRTLRDHDPALRLIIGGPGVPNALKQGAGVLHFADTEQLSTYVELRQFAQPHGALPDDITDGVGLGTFVDGSPVPGGGLHARVAQTTAAAADAARAHARRAYALEQIAYHDPLTELWNRRAFDDRFQMLNDDEPISPPPTILMIDIDHFKSINDGFGHDAGDQALIGVAHCITKSIRPTDFAARYGGDEFVVLLPETRPEIAAVIGERIRRQIEQDLTEPPITVSIGVRVPSHTDRRRTLLDVDNALYAAKEHGRNQVAFA
jgi:diguanylate cyclase (GGDEF)-like protein